MSDWKRYSVRWFCPDCNQHHDVDLDAPSREQAAQHVLICLMLVMGPPAIAPRVLREQIDGTQEVRFEIPITLTVEPIGDAMTEALPVWTNPADVHGPN